MTLPRFYPILDTAVASRCGLTMAGAAEQMLQAGVRLLQIRHKAAWTREALDEAEGIATMCRRFGATLVINDRADIAGMLNAGLHVGQDDLSPELARRVLPADSLAGLSTHNEDQMRDAAYEPVDYVAFGPVFPTASKDNPDPVTGLELLESMRRLTERPLVAIGGIARENAPAVFAAGADCVAVIGDLYSGNTLRERAAEWVKVCG